MPEYETHSILRMRLSEYISETREIAGLSNYQLINYWLCDIDFSNNEFEIEFAFSTIIHTVEREYNPDNQVHVFRQWFALLGLYFLDRDDDAAFSPQRQVDFANFCLFLVENFHGGFETTEKLGATAYKKKRSEKGNDKKWEELRPMINMAIEEYPVAARLILNAGEKLTYESIAETIWPKIQRLNIGPDGKEIIAPDEDPIGRVIAWLKSAREKNKITSPVELRGKK